MGWQDGLAFAYIRIVAYIILLGQLPIPVFWIFVHPFTAFWRGRSRFAYALVALPVWCLCAAAVLGFRDVLFVSQPVALLRILLGFLLGGIDLWLMSQVKSDLGWRRLVGLGELSPASSDASASGGERLALSQKGIYGSLRHPRYAGMILSVTGAWLFVGTGTLAVVLATWLIMVLVIVQLEERELRQRFGSAYEEYARRVPRFLPRFHRTGWR